MRQMNRAILALMWLVCAFIYNGSTTQAQVSPPADNGIIPGGNAIILDGKPINLDGPDGVQNLVGQIMPLLWLDKFDQFDQLLGALNRPEQRLTDGRWKLAFALVGLGAKVTQLN